MDSTKLAAIGFYILVILVIIFAPLLSIWALDTLFGLAIPFTFKTWLAAALLVGAVRGGK